MFCNNDRYHLLANFLEPHLGSLAKNYMNEDGKWISLEEVGGVLVEVGKEVQAKIEGWPISNIEDRRVCDMSHTSYFTIKDAYLSMVQDGLRRKDHASTLIWSKSGLPKDNAFVWVAWYYRALRWDRLQLMGHRGPSLCVLCYNSGEDNNHLFIYCEYVGALWGWFLQKWRLAWTLPRDIPSLIEG
ncbi:hypothetical protein SUGI_0412860 [Cryptomeria japonica]|nr:hypothetical protein SUGI_0412860 [Cryptomeria japonica]